MKLTVWGLWLPFVTCVVLVGTVTSFRPSEPRWGKAVYFQVEYPQELAASSILKEKWMYVAGTNGGSVPFAVLSNFTKRQVVICGVIAVGNIMLQGLQLRFQGH